MVYTNITGIKTPDGFNVEINEEVIVGKNNIFTFILQDHNYNFIASFNEMIEAEERAYIEFKEQKDLYNLKKWYISKDTKLSDLSNQDKRNLINLVGFELRFCNNKNVYYIECYLDLPIEEEVPIEDETFNTLDEVVIAINEMIKKKLSAKEMKSIVSC